MPSTYTLNNGIELIGTGEQSGTWGDTTNLNLELLDTALDGQVTVTLSSTGTSGSPNVLPISDGTSSNGRNRMVIFNDGSDIGGTVYVQLTPNDAEKIVYVRNSLSGSRSILLFQGTYNASNDYEIPAGTTAIVFFNGAGTGAVASNVFNNAYFDSLRLGGVSVTAILDEDDMSSDSATALATQQSIKKYVDDKAAAQDTLAEVLANGNTTGGNGIVFSAGDNITNASGDLTIDVAGDIILDADGANIIFKDGGTEFGQILTNATPDKLVIRSSISDEDMVFQGNDGGSIISALTLDMSAAGEAQFNAGAAFNGNISNVGTYDGSFYYSPYELPSTSVASNSPRYIILARTNSSGRFINGTLYGARSAASSATRTARYDVAVSINSSGDIKNANVTQYGYAPSSVVEVKTFTYNTVTYVGLYIGSSGSSAYPTGYYFQGIASNIGDVITVDDSLVTNVNNYTGTVGYTGLRNQSFIVYDHSTTLNENGSSGGDFQVKTDSNSHALFVDAGNNRVGLFTSTPSVALEVLDPVSSNFNGAIRIGDSGSSRRLVLEQVDVTTYKMGGTGLNSITQFVSGGTSGVGDVRTTIDADGNLSHSKGAVFNETGGNNDFQVKSDNNPNMLLVDAGDDYVAIGGQLNTQNANITVNANDTAVYATNTLDSGGGLSIYKHTSTQTNGDSVGLVFRVTTDNAASNALGAIRYVQPTFGTFAGQMVFQTRNFNGNYYEQLRLDSQTGTLFNSQGDNFLDFQINSDSYSPFFNLDAGNNKLRIGSYHNDDGSIASIGSNATQTFSASNIEGQLAVSLVNNSQGNGQHSSLRFRVSANNGSSNASAAIGLRQPSYASHNSQLNFQLRSQSQNYIRNYFVIDSEIGAVFNPQSEDNQDFQVKTASESHCLFVDAGHNKIGMGMSDPSTYGSRLAVEMNGGSNNALISCINTASSGTRRQIDFFDGSSTSRKGSIETDGTGTFYNTTSDRRLKENIEAITDGTNKLMAMNPVSYTWIANPEAPAVHGFIAQEMQEVVPEAVSGEDGGEEMMSMDYGRITPVLVAALQDAHNKIEALETRLAELEAK